MATQQKFFGVTDGEFKRITFEARTPQEQARDVAALVIKRLKRQRDLKSLRSPTARQLLYALCYEHSEIESFGEGTIALIVHKNAKQIADLEGLTKLSAYRPLQLLESKGIIRRIPAGGNRPDHYEVVIPLASEEEKREAEDEVRVSNASSARAACESAAQTESHAARALHPSDTCGVRNHRTSNELSAGGCAVSHPSDTSKSADVSFSTDNPLVSHVARAGTSPINSTTTTAVVGEEKKAEAAEVRMVLEELNVWPNVIPELLGRCSLWLALAVQAEVAGKTTPGKLAAWIIKETDPEARISPKARAKADREIRKRKGIDTPPAAASVTRKSEQETISREESQVEATIARLTDDELKEMAAAVLEKYQGNVAVVNVLTKKPPRECRLMKMEIAAMLTGGNLLRA